MQKLEITNSFGEKLAGMFESSDGSKKLVILCHGRLCTKDKFFLPALSKALSENGFACFRFDFSGNGESQGSFEESTITKEISDIKAVADYFSKKRFTIHSIIGHSKGGVDALLFQVKHAKALSIVSIGALVNQEYETSKKYSKAQVKELQTNGFFEVKSNGKKFRVSRQYYFDRLKYGDISYGLKKISVPVLVVHGTKDKDTDFKNASLLYKALGSKSKLLAVNGAGHYFDKSVHRKALVDNVADWLKKLPESESIVATGSKPKKKGSLKNLLGKFKTGKSFDIVKEHDLVVTGQRATRVE